MNTTNQRKIYNYKGINYWPYQVFILKNHWRLMKYRQREEGNLIWDKTWNLTGTWMKVKGDKGGDSKEKDKRCMGHRAQRCIKL